MLKITTRAKQQLNNLIDKQGKSALLYLKGGGCNGFSYKFKVLQKEIRKLGQRRRRKQR